MDETKQIIGKKLYQAAEFMIELLAEGEMLSEEVYQLAAQRGISNRTLMLAKKVVWAKARRANGRWYMFLQEGAREQFAKYVKARGSFPTQSSQRSRGIAASSSDWMAVVVDTGKFDVCETLANCAGGGLHIKVGTVEFTADSAFPTEKLIEVLRGLRVDS